LYHTVILQKKEGYMNIYKGYMDKEATVRKRGANNFLDNWRKWRKKIMVVFRSSIRSL